MMEINIFSLEETTLSPPDFSSGVIMERRQEFVEISHGGGGKQMDRLIAFLSQKIGLENADSDTIGPLAADDSAVVDFPFPDNKLVLTTDSHTVDPIFFRGGNIGDLSISGTINDLTVMGAQPLYFTLSMIIEEGYSFEKLGKIATTIGEQCRDADVRIVCGDTKVMPKGTLSNIVLNTAGVGNLVRSIPIADSGAKVGDKIIITGPIGDHGTSLMSLREGLEFETTLESDVAPFWPSFKDIVSNQAIHAMKDLTRGGLASAVNEIAMKSNVCLLLEEELIPIRQESQAIADILGLEIMEVSCEGSAVLCVDPSSADALLQKFHKHKVSEMACIVGTVRENPKGRVHILTDIGGTRIL
ncbi:MAG: hydrogenase expression/formation protein HypE, partial [Candidatus Kariarchaeaceae archaeon]